MKGGCHLQSLVGRPNYYKLANEWVWLESQICTKWLKVSLAQASSARYQQKAKYSAVEPHYWTPINSRHLPYNRHFRKSQMSFQ